MLTEKRVWLLEKTWKREKELIQRKQKVEKEREQLQPRKKITTTKLLMYFLFLNCAMIELFVGWVTVQNINLAVLTGAYIDYTPLVTLIGAVVGQVISFGIYAIKSTKENTQGGIIYDSAMQNLNFEEFSSHKEDEFSTYG